MRWGPSPHPPLLAPRLPPLSPLPPVGPLRWLVRLPTLRSSSLTDLGTTRDGSQKSSRCRRACRGCDRLPGRRTRCRTNCRRVTRGWSPTPRQDPAGRFQAISSSTLHRTSPTPTPTRSPPCHTAHTRSPQSSLSDSCMVFTRWRRSGESLSSDLCHSCNRHYSYSSPAHAGSCPCLSSGIVGPTPRPALPSPTPLPSATDTRTPSTSRPTSAHPRSLSSKQAPASRSCSSTASAPPARCAHSPTSPPHTR